MAEAESITLADGGTVTGDREGAWEADGDRVLLTLDGEEISAETFRQWDEAGARWVTTLTGLTSGSTALAVVPRG